MQRRKRESTEIAKQGVIRGELVTQSQPEEIDFEIRELKTVKFQRGQR
jgi:hypothetical protein